MRSSGRSEKFSRYAKAPHSSDVDLHASCAETDTTTKSEANDTNLSTGLVENEQSSGAGSGQPLSNAASKAAASKSEEALLRDEFMAVASHELRTPLTSMKLHNDLVRMIAEREGHTVSKEQLVKLLNLMDQQIHRLERIVSDMLEVFRIKEGKISLTKEEFDIASLGESILEKLKNQVMLQLTPSPEISLSGKIIGRWDKQRIEKMLTHILTNAFKYGKGKPVAVKIIQLGDQVRIEVSDQGNGISTQFKEKIFQKFERGISSNEVSGFGLGLYYSKKVVEAHGGKIWFETENEQGTKFIIELPLNANGVSGEKEELAAH